MGYNHDLRIFKRIIVLSYWSIWTISKSWDHLLLLSLEIEFEFELLMRMDHLITHLLLLYLSYFLKNIALYMWLHLYMCIVTACRIWNWAKCWLDQVGCSWRTWPWEIINRRKIRVGGSSFHWIRRRWCDDGRVPAIDDWEISTKRSEGH